MFYFMAYNKNVTFCCLPATFSVFVSLRYTIFSSSGLIFLWSSIIWAAKKRQIKLLLISWSKWIIQFFFQVNKTPTQISNPHITWLQHRCLFFDLISDVLQFILQIFKKDRKVVYFLKMNEKVERIHVRNIFCSPPLICFKYAFVWRSSCLFSLAISSCWDKIWNTTRRKVGLDTVNSLDTRPR